MHVSPFLPSDAICSTQLALLEHQLASFFAKYHVDNNRRTTFQTHLKKLFNESFSVQLPTPIQQRALYERELVQSIRRQLKKDHLILRRTADQNNVFYLGCANDFEQKSNDYMNNTTSYEMINTINENDSQQSTLDQIIQLINSVLSNMYHSERISKGHLSKMQVKKLNLHIPYLYFLPESQQDGTISLQPIISSCNHCPIKSLAHYLDELLRPLYDSHTQSTTLSNGADFIERLARYDESHLLPRTRFVTFKVQNLYNLVSHERIIEALGRFLSQVIGIERQQNLSIDTIQELTKLVLRNNVFTYNGKIYRHVKGSPLSLPLTRTLCNIYLHDWQTSLVDKLDYNEEFYGRYHNMIILTWNPPVEKLQPLLIELDQKHADIRITTTIGLSVHFRDAYVENQKGKLYSCVYHEPTLQPFVLPYVIGHPRLFYRQWFQWALRRAVRYCTSMEDFNQERLYIELTLLTNGYSFDFVRYGLTIFFTEHQAATLETYLSQPVYQSLRRRLLDLTQQEKQYYQQQQLWKSNNQLIHLHYLFDWGLRCQFNQKFEELWSNLIKTDRIFTNIELKLKLSSVHCYSLNAILTHETSHHTDA